VTVDPRATLTFDDSRSGSDGLAARHDLQRDDKAAYGWSSSFGRREVWYGRTNIWIERVSDEFTLVSAQAGSSSLVHVAINRYGNVLIEDRNGKTLASSKARIEFGSWARVEWMIDHRAGTVQVRIYNWKNADRPTETITTARGRSIGSATDRVVFGLADSGSCVTRYWSDDTAVSSTGYLGRA
jgi:hypothetical protein